MNKRKKFMHPDAGPTGCQAMNHLTMKPNPHDRKRHSQFFFFLKRKSLRKSTKKVYNNKHIGLK